MAGNLARLYRPAGCSGAGWPRGGNDRPVYPSRRGTDSRVSPCTSSCKGLSQTAAGSALLESGQIPVAIRNPRELALIEPWFFYLAPTCTYRSSGIQYQHGCSGGPATSCFRMHRLFDPQSAPSSVQNSAPASVKSSTARAPLGRASRLRTTHMSRFSARVIAT